MANKKRSSRSKLSKRRFNRSPLLVIVVILLVAGAVYGLYAYHRSSSKNEAPTLITSTSASNPSKTNSVASKTSDGGSSAPAASSPVDTNQPLQKPSGTFVSNHKPGQNGSGQDEASACNTTPGANCYITFTKNGVAKSLPTTTADNTGAAYWSWTPQTVGLSSGNWSVSATAVLGQQTATTQDPTLLEVE